MSGRTKVTLNLSIEQLASAELTVVKKEDPVVTLQFVQHGPNASYAFEVCVRIT